jgi:acetyl-CoA carboxylase biotin carboxyl carrier protein
MKAAREPRKKNSNAELSAPGVELGQLEKLLDFMAAHELEEFEYEHAGFHIRLKKAPASAIGAAGAAASQISSSQQPVSPAPSPHIAEPSSTGAAAATEDLHVIKSPIVGTFYSAPSPGAPPFAKIGDEIQVGQVVCIVEAMKLMNEIESDVSGELVRCLVENGQPVEYGQGLFAIRTAKKK